MGTIEFFSFFCNNFARFSKNICEKYVKIYPPPFIEALIEHYFRGEYICNSHLLCKFNYIKFFSADEFAEKILKNYNNIESPEDFYIKNKSISSTWKVAQITDFHIDLDYVEGSVGNCINPICCHDNQENISYTKNYFGKIF